MISHHHADTAVAEQIRGALVEHPGQPEVLLDSTDLEAGDDWARRIEEWLARCHVFVLVVSRKALDSAWVAYEAGNAAFKARQLSRGNPSATFFRLVPVMLDGLDGDNLRWPQHFRPLRLDEFQALSVDRAQPDCRALLGCVSDVQRALTAASRPPVVGVLLGLLKQLEELLPGLAELLQLSPGLPGRLAQSDQRLVIANRLLSIDLPTLLRLATEVANPTLGLKLLRLLFPHSFVPDGPARALQAHVLESPPAVPVSLKAELKETPRHYLRKALGDPEPRVLDCATRCGHLAPLDDLRRAVHQALVTEILDGEGLDDLPVEGLELEAVLGQVRRALAAWIEDCGRPVVMTLHPELAGLDAALIERLATDYRPLQFFLRTEESGQAVARRFSRLLLLPDLPAGEEANAETKIRRLRKDLKYRRSSYG